FLSGAILLAIIFHKKLPNIQQSTLIKGAILGIILYAAFALQTVGLQFTTPSKSGFLTAINVVIVPFIGMAFFRKKLNKFELIGACLAILGVALLSLHFPF